MSEEKILQAINGLGDRIDILDKKIDTVGQELKQEIVQTNERIDKIKEDFNTRLDMFQQETRENFATLSRNTNERIAELDKKIDQKFDKVNKDMGIMINTVLIAVDKNYERKKNN